MQTVCTIAFICSIFKRSLQAVSHNKSMVIFWLVFFTFCLTQFLISRDKGNILPPHTIKILIWKWPYARRTNLTGNVCADLYDIHGCHLTDNQSAFNQADVVVFHHNDIYPSVATLPTEKWRPHLQKWVWLSLESPTNNRKINQLNGIFNWTMSYRRDSDIFIPYGELVPNIGHPFSIPKKISHLAAWVVSNYRESHKRTGVFHSLQKSMAIDMYGRANGKPLSKDSLLQTISKYPFYLAFENSIHQDYITEKLWRNSFMAGSVPVVLGPSRTNYEAFVPAGSFIHVQDFPSTKELAEYLMAVANNETHYRQYFEWKKQFTVKMYEDWRERFCQICKKYKTLPQRKIYHNLEEWINS
ncbi:alpha-(1,3)-fucosyltransferase 7-like [Polypterus senegalus]|nr:alpha-(1,3)-fucosyltransferase 7-like [Polypterus senegalus]